MAWFFSSARIRGDDDIDYGGAGPELKKEIGDFLSSFIIQVGGEEDLCVVRRKDFGVFCKIKHEQMDTTCRVTD
jgi:hypothetical protein